MNPSYGIILHYFFNKIHTVYYYGQGTGNLYIKAKQGSSIISSEIYVVDYHIVDPTEHHSGGCNAGCFTRIRPDFTFPNGDWELTADFKEAHNGGQFGVYDASHTLDASARYASCVKQGNNYYLSGLQATNDGGIWNRSTTYMNTGYYPIKIRKEGNTIKYYLNDNLMDTTSSTDFASVTTLALCTKGYYNQTNTYVKNIKIKAL